MAPNGVDEILRRMDSQDKVLVEIRTRADGIEAQAKLTNGRVTELEKWREFVRGGHAALAWRTPLLIGVVCAAVGGAIGTLLA